MMCTVGFGMDGSSVLACRWTAGPTHSGRRDSTAASLFTSITASDRALLIPGEGTRHRKLLATEPENSRHDGSRGPEIMQVPGQRRDGSVPWSVKRVGLPVATTLAETHTKKNTNTCHTIRKRRNANSAQINAGDRSTDRHKNNRQRQTLG